MEALLASVRGLHDSGAPLAAVKAALDDGAPTLAGAGRDALAAALGGEPAAPRSLVHLYLL
jgi:hypothetical protein